MAATTPMTMPAICPPVRRSSPPSVLSVPVLPLPDSSSLAVLVSLLILSSAGAPAPVLEAGAARAAAVMSDAAAGVFAPALSSACAGERLAARMAAAVAKEMTDFFMRNNSQLRRIGPQAFSINYPRNSLLPPPVATMRSHQSCAFSVGGEGKHTILAVAGGTTSTRAREKTRRRPVLSVRPRPGDTPIELKNSPRAGS